MRSLLLALAVGLSAAVSSVPAYAQSSGASVTPYPAACASLAVTQTKSDEAHAFYNAGRALYDEGNYDGAVAQFRESYKRDCSKHELLIIISRSHELKGDKVEAVRALELFRERVKDSPDEGTHRTKIENLKKQIAAQPPPPPPVATPPAEVREHTVAPWIVVGIGGAALVAGVIVLVTSPSLPTGCNAGTKLCTAIAGEDSGAFDKRKDEAGTFRSQPIIGGAIIAGGAVLVAGGLLWHFLEPTGPVAKGSLSPKLTPNVAPAYAGMSFGGTF